MCQTYHPGSKDPIIAGFTERFQKKFGRLPDPNAAQSYDAIEIVLAALEKAGVKDKSKIRDAVAATNNFKGVTGTITFDNTGDAPRNMMIIQIRDGKYELYK
jgi:branched-chain amino acid transport system substrate-binding protein